MSSTKSKQSAQTQGKKSQPTTKGNKRDVEDSDFDEDTEEDDEEEDGLLPEDVSPVHYALHLRPNYADFTFTARVVILLKITEATDQIQFNSADLVIVSASLATTSAGVLTPTRILEDEEEEVVTLRFDEPLQIGEATLTIAYRGKVSDKMNGLYKTEYLHQGVTQTILVTQFEACDARRVLPCWDEPARKATFGVTLCVPAKYTALSNMPSLSTTQIEGGEWIETTFQPTPIMSTYLLAFAIGEFESIQTTTKTGVLIRLLTPLGKIDQGAFSLELGKQCVEFYSDYFSLDC
jgi:aminopeptidase N